MRLELHCAQCLRPTGDTMQPSESALRKAPMFWIANVLCDSCEGPVVMLLPRRGASEKDIADLRADARKTWKWEREQGER